MTSEELGGASVHTAKSGVIDGAFRQASVSSPVRRLIDFAWHRGRRATLADARSGRYDDASLDTLIPDNPNKPYDIKG